jgi:hypothetical protein
VRDARQPTLSGTRIRDALSSLAWDYRNMLWQDQMLRDISSGLPEEAVLEVVGSVEEPALVDGWSDLDIHLRLPECVELTDLLGGDAVWAVEAIDSDAGQVVRAVLADGRRLDIVVEFGRLRLPTLASDNEVRFLAALAVSKLGRGDRLVGGHLVLELLQYCLVQAMLLRDRDEGKTIHRTGTARDALADEVQRLAQLPLEVTARPSVVEQIASSYGQWRQEWEPGYESDWSGLAAVLRRGLAQAPPDPGFK